MTQTEQREDLAEKASEFLLGVLERMGISADIDIKDDTDKTVLEIQTGDTELVIGRRGVVIDARARLVVCPTDAHVAIDRRGLDREHVGHDPHGIWPAHANDADAANTRRRRDCRDRVIARKRADGDDRPGDRHADYSAGTTRI